jgi:hypothetical protein
MVLTGGLPRFDHLAGFRIAHRGIEQLAPLRKFPLDGAGPVLKRAARPMRIALQIPGEVSGFNRPQGSGEAVAPAFHP